MKITYDKSFGQAYIDLHEHEGHPCRTIEVQRGVLLDVHVEDGEVCGIELIGSTLIAGLKNLGEVTYL